MTYERFIKTLTGVNFRAGAGTDYDSIRVLPINTVVQVLEEVPGVTWFRAQLEDGTVGYITSLTKYVAEYEPEWLTIAKKVIEYGDTYLGTPYSYGSSRYTDETFDCSDFVQWIYKRAASISLPWDSRQQSVAGEPVSIGFDTLRTGDLLFFDTNGDKIVNHVGIYVYPNKLFHTNSKTADVNDRNFNLIKDNGGGVTWIPYVEGNNYWRNKTTGARRVIID